MLKRRLKLVIGLSLLMFMSIGLTISTLHSHHNLDLHNSTEFADTGHCLNADITLCPICAHLLEGNEPHSIKAQNDYVPFNVVVTLDDSAIPSRAFIPVLGRSPPVVA